MTKIKLELITNLHMLIFFQKRREDRFFYISNRCSKAKNNNLKFYDLKQESKHIICLDANNLYGLQRLNFFQQVNSNG